MKGLTIKEILRKNKFTQQQVADLLNTTVQNLSQLLSKDDVRTSLVESISEATGIPMSVFYGEAPVAIANGANSEAVAGNNNHTTVQTARFLEELAAQRKVTEKSQEQIDRLLGIIETISHQ